MAVLQKIRNRSGLMIGIIGFAMVSFIVMDAFNSQGFLLGGSSNDIAEIAGTNITYQEFNQKLNEVIDNYKLNANKKNIDTETNDLLMEQTWNQLLFETVMNNEYEKVGLDVGSEEMFDLVQGSEPHSLVVQAFTNPETGEFNPSQILQFLKNMEFDPSGESKTKWLQLEQNIYSSRKSEKYNNLIKKGLYVTNAQAQNEYISQNKNINIDFVDLPYSSVADTSVIVTDNEIQDYYSKHIKKYKQEESRTIEYVTFDVIPSANDTLEIFNSLVKLNEEFKTTTDDSIFVNLNSDIPFDNVYHKKGTLSPIIDTIMFTADTGFNYGPYLENGYYKISKFVDKKNIPDSVNARHILIKPTAEKGGLKASLNMADSLKKELENGKSFAEMANANSEDPGSKIKGGDLGWFTQGTMVKPFNDAVFYYGKKGDITVVTSQFGVHLIEIIDTKNDSIGLQIATIARKIEPSTFTGNEIFKQANTFSTKCHNPDAFNKIIVDEGLSKRIAENIKENDRTIIGLKNPREIIRWAFKEDEGTISKKVFELEDKFVIVLLKNVIEEGTTPIENIKIQIEVELKKEKKGIQLKAKLEDALAKVKTIEELAKILETEVQSAQNITFFNGYVSGIGRDLKLVGAAFAAQPNVISNPVAGEFGAYVFIVKSITDAPAQQNYTDMKNQLQSKLTQSIDYEVYNALKDKANVFDNRSNFY